MMTCAELQDCYELHALGLLEEPERSELEEHLRRGCSTCAPAMRQARAMTAKFSSLAPADVAPPARLRKRVVESVGGRSWDKGKVIGWVLAFANLVVAVAWLSVQDARRQNELAAARGMIERSQSDLQRVREALTLLDEPDTKQVTFGTQEPKPPRGRVFVSKRGVLLLASNLPLAGPGKTYELWLIPKGQNPRPAGLFLSDEAGRALYLSRGDVDIATLGAVAVSLEPEGGSPQPTTTPLIVAPVGD